MLRERVNMCVVCLYVCVCLRLVCLVVRLREWAHRSLLEEEERPDSFLERFRGPELRMAPSRISNTQPDANGNEAKGIFRYVRLPVTLKHYCALFTCTLSADRTKEKKHRINQRVKIKPQCPFAQMNEMSIQICDILCCFACDCNKL